jgi:DNA-binding response OmpR family regulator
MTSCAERSIAADSIEWLPVNCATMADKKPAALVAEDDDQISYILRFILEREGYDVHLAPDGRTALQLIAKLQPPAIAIFDVMLPQADGYELLARLRATPGWAAVPVIMLTARSQEQDIVRGLEAGANDYMVKPFKPEELRARIRRLLKK